MSADPVKAQAAFKAKQNLNFPLLSDPTHKTIEKFGAWQKKQFMGRTFMGIVRSSFLIGDRKSTRLNSSHGYISYAVFCLKKKKQTQKLAPTDKREKRLRSIATLNENR